MKIKFLILLIAPIFFTNCGKDDTGKTYEGNWIGSSEEITGCKFEEDNSSIDLTCDANSCYRLTLKGDGSFTFQEGQPLIEGTWEVSGSTLSLCSEDDGENVCVAYASTIGTTLTLNVTNSKSLCTTVLTFSRE
jgi:hypothetical protein